MRRFRSGTPWAADRTGERICQPSAVSAAPGPVAFAGAEEALVLPSHTPKRGIEASDVIGSANRLRTVCVFQFAHQHVDEARAYVVSGLPLYEAYVWTCTSLHYLVEHIILARCNR